VHGLQGEVALSFGLGKLFRDIYGLVGVDLDGGVLSEEDGMSVVGGIEISVL
jgi:hypothetical protein